MSVSAFAEILELAIVSTASRDLLHVIDSPVGLVVIRRDLVWTVPMVARCSHACILRLVVVVFLAVAHANAVHVLRLTLANHRAHGLGHVVGAHRWLLLACIVSEIYVIDTTLPHLVLGRHRHLALHVGRILRG